MTNSMFTGCLLPVKGTHSQGALGEWRIQATDLGHVFLFQWHSGYSSNWYPRQISGLCCVTSQPTDDLVDHHFYSGEHLQCSLLCQETARAGGAHLPPQKQVIEIEGSPRVWGQLDPRSINKWTTTNTPPSRASNLVEETHPLNYSCYSGCICWV